VGDVAQEYGLVIILETHPPLILNGDVGRKTMEKVNHPAIRINYDTANMFHYNKKIDGLEELRKILPFVEGVHLKESNKKFKSWYFPGFGEGDGCMDFKGVFDLLNNREEPVPFFGPFTMEIEGIKGEKKLTLEESKARVAISVDYLRNIGVFE
jgi:inosose dehydratase